jgi:SagB-type dehydrogenase family enzyme
MAEAHAATSLDSPQEVSELWGKPPSLAVYESQGRLFPLSYPPAEELPQDAIEDVILRRGSSRRFRRSPITFQQLSIMLDRAARPVPADFLGDADATLNQLYLIVNDVAGLPSGSFVYRRDLGTLEQLEEGDFRDQAGRLDLGQELSADASVNVYSLTDLNAVLERYGNRGYRMAQMEASITAGRLYLAAYAQRLGATGLTFFDDEVTEFFSPHAAGKSVMFLLAVGRPGRRG